MSAGTSLQDNNVQLKGVFAKMDTKINQLENQMHQYGEKQQQLL